MITSKDNPLVKEARRLKETKYRRETGLFIAEGPHLVKELLASPFRIKRAFVSGEQPTSEETELARLLTERKIPVAELSGAVLRSVCETENPQGILAVAEERFLPSLPEIAGAQKYTVLIADRLRDPGNLGVLLRTAWGFAVDLCIITPGTADPFNGKTVRASMGGIFHLPLVKAEPETVMDWALRNGLAVYGGDARAEQPVSAVSFPAKVGLVVGNEGAGLSPAWSKHSSWQKICVPMPGGAESLNVAAAAAIMLYEMAKRKEN